MNYYLIGYLIGVAMISLMTVGGVWLIERRIRALVSGKRQSLRPPQESKE